VDLPGEGPSPEAVGSHVDRRSRRTFDNAAVDEAEQAEIDAAADARDAAGFLADQVRINAQYHP
jgi:hypothetical protein